MLNSFAELQTFMTQTMTELGGSAEFAPHGVFWQTLSYDQCVNGNMPGIAGAPVKILVSGASSQSNIIHALKGEGIFAPGGRFRRMPAGGPYFSEEQIKEIADWIEAGCPEQSGGAGE